MNIIKYSWKSKPKLNFLQIKIVSIQGRSTIKLTYMQYNISYNHPKHHSHNLSCPSNALWNIEQFWAIAISHCLDVLWMYLFPKRLHLHLQLCLRKFFLESRTPWTQKIKVCIFFNRCQLSFVNSKSVLICSIFHLFLFDNFLLKITDLMKTHRLTST